MLGERMTRSRAGSIVLGFLGVLVIVRPGLASFQPAALLVLCRGARLRRLADRHQELTATRQHLRDHVLDER